MTLEPGRRPPVPGTAPLAYERVVALLYVLMRDDVAFGRVAARVRELEEAESSRFTFSNAAGEALARDFADRLWRGECEDRDGPIESQSRP